MKTTNLTRVRALTIALDSTSDNGIGVPDNLSMVQEQYGVEIVDAWDRPFRLRRRIESKPAIYEIRSDGPDRTPETEDDLAWPYEPSKAAIK